jgi:SPP1 family predicted phage head-tail adaptor|tara:strand:+ start:75 stop:395 length:321 start_codon:yes stop_codon:yes gene_type:complete
MKFGLLDRRITIEHLGVNSGTDSWNVDATSWINVRSCWGKKKDNSSREGVELQQLTNVTSTVWRIRYVTDVTTEMRILYNSKYYYITGITEIGRREGLDLITELRQ